MIRRARLVSVVALLCVAAAPTSASPPVSAPACPSAVSGLGRIAFVTRAGLELADLRSCRVRRVAFGGAWSPQFSPDGRWLAYSRRAPDHSGSPIVISAGGGHARSPLGPGVQIWWWAPHGATLYGATRAGQLVRARPGGHDRVVAGGARTFRNAMGASPDGRRVATDSSGCIPPGFALDTVTVASGAQHVAVTRPSSLSTFAGFSPDGRWLLYWARSVCSASLSADGWPLDAVPASGAQAPVRAVAHTLLFPDFLTWCGGRLIAASTPSRATQLGSRLVATGPPAWHQRTIAPTSHLSWVSPTCAPSGSLLAAAAGPSSTHSEFGIQHRSIWLLSPTGRVMRRLTTPPASDLSDETPRFSRDGRWILFVRSHVVTVTTTSTSHDTLELVPAAGSGPAATIPIASFTSNDVSFYDHFQWPSEIAWSAAAN
jgi:Tol biopolymer transport system component